MIITRHQYLEETGVTVVVVATKIDKLRPSEVESAMDRMQTAYGARGHQVIPFSALTGHGKKDLWRAIRDNLLTAEEEEEEEAEDGY
jgi:GTP-binding protein EngB required for normal cell division